jgi:uncharacterized Tic20 family protein
MNITTEDRVWAVISHLSALAFGMGIALPVVGWSDQRRKSNYASFQSLQALGYQSLGFTIWALAYLVVTIIAAFILVLLVERQGSSSVSMDVQMRTWIVLISVLLLGLLVVYFVLPVVAAVACLLGRDFRYPVLGDRLARYLRYQPSAQSEQMTWLDEDHEIRWVAAMGHFSILIVLWGMLAPLLAWILQGRQNLFLKFQSVQTLVYQALTTILYFAASFLFLIGSGVVVASFDVLDASNLHSSFGVLELVILGILFLFASLFLLLVPLVHILGQWAGYRVLKGDNYRYPLVGLLVEKQILKNYTLEKN